MVSFYLLPLRLLLVEKFGVNGAWHYLNGVIKQIRNDEAFAKVKGNLLPFYTSGFV